jgi:Co/Zn/Cd efflux system component
LWVLGTTAYEAVAPGLPKAEVMGIVGFLALAANLASVLLLLRYRAGDANVRSVWLCSRNDAIGNVAVVIAAGAVWLFGSAWPDLVVAAMISSLFLWSAASITRQAVGELRRSSIQRDPD